MADESLADDGDPQGVGGHVGQASSAHRLITAPHIHVIQNHIHVIQNPSALKPNAIASHIILRASRSTMRSGRTSTHRPDEPGSPERSQSWLHIRAGP